MDLAIARALHVLAVIVWIGGVAMVTTVLLPAIRGMPDAEDPVAFFERVERRFALQARVVTVVAALTGFYMLHRTHGWSRYLTLDSWWLHAMTLVWVIFTLILFVGEPLVLHRVVHERGRRDPQGTLALLQRVHVVLLTLSLVAVFGAVAGSHGWVVF